MLGALLRSMKKMQDSNVVGAVVNRWVCSSSLLILRQMQVQLVVQIVFSLILSDQVALHSLHLALLVALQARCLHR